MVQKWSVVAALAAAAVGLAVGVLIGVLGSSKPTIEEWDMMWTMEDLMTDQWVDKKHLNERIINLVNADNIRSNLKILSEKPHLAATPRDNYLAELIKKRFLEAGFDNAELVSYNVLLSRPNPEKPNLITLINGTGDVVFTSTYKEVPLQDDDADPEFVHAFNAYAPAGDLVTAAGTGLVYVNYGRVEDFDKLEELGVPVKDTIVIARYGKIFRGNKLLHAQERGAKGVILFSDPRDVAPEGVKPEDVYPKTMWLPGSGMQRGSTYINSGDPLTPGWPSTANAYRLEKSETDLPKIPCQPIGYDDARVILEKMGGTAAPPDWKGGLEGVAYNLGPQLLPQYSAYRLRLTTHNTNAIYKSYNVIGTIKGSIEPDRYVLIGNHRDAWGYGASDPSSGTAQMLETARVFGELLKEEWRPRRTLVFCSWGAEEYALIGSYEWVEEHVSKLQERAVMYLNTDTCVSGPIFNANGSPLVWDSITEVTKMVPGVRDGKTTYDEWAAYHAHWNRTSPEMKTLGSGSDHAPFTFYCGIPSMDMWFRTDKRKHNISTYPYYHTGYETFYMVDQNVDPGFRIHQGCSRIAALTLRYFADSAILPYSLSHLPKAMKKALDSVNDKGNREKLIDIYPKYYVLEEALENFMAAVDNFENKLMDRRDNLNPVSMRTVNDQLMKLEQTFIIPTGLPGRPQYRHAIFAPSKFDGYTAAGFPGIVDLLYGIDDLGPSERQAREKEIKMHVSHLTILIQSAASYLDDLHFI